MIGDAGQIQATSGTATPARLCCRSTIPVAQTAMTLMFDERRAQGQKNELVRLLETASSFRLANFRDRPTHPAYRHDAAENATRTAQESAQECCDVLRVSQVSAEQNPHVISLLAPPHK
jgi:hypothetical protein